MAGSIGDILTIARMTTFSRCLAYGVVGGLENISFAPKGNKENSRQSLDVPRICLVADGKEKLSTPIHTL